MVLGIPKHFSSYHIGILNYKQKQDIAINQLVINVLLNAKSYLTTLFK